MSLYHAIRLNCTLGGHSAAIDHLVPELQTISSGTL
jgi:hypothetical protein